MIKLPAYLTGFSSRSDGSAGLRFATQELNEQEFGELKRNLNQFGYLLFKESTIQDEDIPKDNIIDDKDKTPSKRLRAILFVLWKQKGDNSDFELYYRNQVEKIIEHIKSKLDE